VLSQASLPLAKTKLEQRNTALRIMPLSIGVKIRLTFPEESTFEKRANEQIEVCSHFKS
jgi:hypothetical protein